MRDENKNVIPVWGPYSKKYMGISRIMKESSIPGARFDLVIYPTYANSGVPVPNVTVPSDYHPWDCDSDGQYYQYRYELLWKDQLYADVDIFCIEEETWGIRVSYHNNTDKNQNCLLNYFAAEEYPKSRLNQLHSPKKSDTWNAVAYDSFSCGKKLPWENLNQDALKKGEIPVDGFTEDNGLGMSYYAMMLKHLGLNGFGGNIGDKVSYRIHLSGQYENAVLCIRYRTLQNEEAVVFNTNYGKVTFRASSHEAAICQIPLGELNEKEFYLEMENTEERNNGVMLDCFCICEKTETENVRVTEEAYNVIPRMEYEGDLVKYQYNYGEVPVYFGILSKRVRSRKIYSGCLEDALVTRLTNADETYDNLTRPFSGAFMDKHSDEGYYHVNVVEALFVPGQSTRTEYAYISTKNKEYSRAELEKCWESRIRKVREEQQVNEEGNQYDFTANMMKSALYTNVVYPIKRHGEYIAHYTPGKRWDSLYTWDSGFIGLGLLEYSPKLAEYIMDTYLSEEDNKDFAFVAHGSLVPTQFYLMYELLMRASEAKRRDMKKYYPMFLRYYRFMAGKTENSTTARLGSGLMTVYDYFYNASGMDDYPAQAEMHRQKLEDSISPVCSNVHFIRIAKIMSRIAKICGYEEDIPEFEQDMKKVSDALLTYAWDEESGYFGYTLHDKDGVHIFRTEKGENFNKGVDGVTPLLAGICNAEQEEKMLAHLKSPDELWSKVGISTVDMSAGYFYDNGYWNGSVWCPYQYLLWKSMLDVGEGKFAFEIAQRALTSWKQETEFSYNTFEMIQIETERGGWFHQFGGLSAPIVVWYHAYYKRGTITTGYDTWIDKSEFSDETDCAEIFYSLNQKRKNCIIVVMNSNYDYEVKINGYVTEFVEHVKGALEIPLCENEGRVQIYKV